MPKQIQPLSISPRRQNMVIDDELTHGIEFTQAAKSGNVLILYWIPKSDRLYRWLDGKWIAIKSEAITLKKKQFLSETKHR